MARIRTPASGLTHLDAANRPTMVDVGAKSASAREAIAEARVRLPPAVARALAASGHRTKKGPVYDTAIIAGVQAVKRTHELIPFCHPLPIERCEIDVDARRGGLVVVRCTVGVFHKTGVEMEALTGAVAAALTIYDMCKALSHDIVIEDVRLLGKRGGRRDFMRAPAATAARGPATRETPPRRAAPRPATARPGPRRPAKRRGGDR